MLLVGADVVLCSLLPNSTEEQIALATAAKDAGVGRFVPSWWGPAMPPRGIAKIKEQVRCGLLSLIL